MKTKKNETQRYITLCASVHSGAACVKHPACIVPSKQGNSSSRKEKQTKEERKSEAVRVYRERRRRERGGRRRKKVNSSTHERVKGEVIREEVGNR